LDPFYWTKNFHELLRIANHESQIANTRIVAALLDLRWENLTTLKWAEQKWIELKTKFIFFLTLSLSLSISSARCHLVKQNVSVCVSGERKSLWCSKTMMHFRARACSGYSPPLTHTETLWLSVWRLARVSRLPMFPRREKIPSIPVEILICYTINFFH